MTGKRPTEKLPFHPVLPSVSPWLEKKELRERESRRQNKEKKIYFNAYLQSRTYG